MWGIYIKAALRNILRRRLFSMISVIGLGAGLAIAVMIGLFLRFETGFDKAVPNAERMYRLGWMNVGTGAQFATFFNPLSPKIAAALPDDIESNTRITLSEELLTIDGTKQYETVSFIDPNFFDIFPYGALDGDAAAAIADVRNAVITEAARQHLFGDGDAIGRMITLGSEHDFRVAAVVANNASNSHQVSNIFVNMEMLPTVWGWADMWESNFSDQLYHYVTLKPGITAEAVEGRIMDFLVENVREDARDFVRVPLLPMTDIHFTTELQNEMTARDTITGLVKPARQASDIYIFLAVAVLTLVIAAFNFMNLQTIQISNRMREIGVRKVLGATRRQVVVQFLVETAVLALVALIAAMVIAEVTVPLLGTLVGAPLTSAMLFEPVVLGAMLGVTLLTAAVAGAYPALMAARMLPTLALSGEVMRGVGPAKVRAGLVVLQFAIATGLIAASGVVNSQIDFAFSKPLGFDATGVVVVDIGRRDARDAYASMKTQLSSHPAILNVSGTDVVPTQDLDNGWGFKQEGRDASFDLPTRMINMDAGAFEVQGMQIVAGRTYSQDFPGDALLAFSSENAKQQGGLILNETAARSAGWTNPDDAIGQQLYSSFSNRGVDYRYDFTVVGVVADAHYRSIRSEISPISYFYNERPRRMVVKIDPSREAEAMAAIDAVWAEALPELPIRRSVLADDYAAFYAGENRTFGLFIGFAGIAVLIACLGLYGLTAFMVERRVKEIGIRKVLGATVANIVALFSWEFSKLVIVANVIAWPAVWWIMRDWLASFAYRADLEVTVFLLASVIALVLAGITTSVRTFSAANLNPAHALRRE